MSTRRPFYNVLRVSGPTLCSPYIRAPWYRPLGLRNIPNRLYATHINAADYAFGQPVHETHPHLLKAGEITPGITALEYAQRRSKLAAKLPSNSIAIIAASDISYRSGGVFYEFHQDPDFFYLTGFNEPDALAVISNSGQPDDHFFHLFVREKDRKAEIWDGARSGTLAARDVFNADESGDIAQLRHGLPSIISGKSQVYTDITAPPNHTSSLSQFLYEPSENRPNGLAALVDSSKLRALRPLMNDIRVIKSKSEIANMRQAGKSSGRAFTETIRYSQHAQTEANLDAYLEYQLRVQGCHGSAFEPVIANGSNALSIHYVRNDGTLQLGNLILMDGGGSYGGYITDITRTWPRDGKFSAAQKDLYEAVLSVQRTCVSLCRADATLSLDTLHETAENGLRENLKSLGFDLSKRDAMSTLFPHHVGHHTGLDVHDCAGYSRSNVLVAGNTVTIEPAIYVPDEDHHRWPEHFRGMGIRIEDTIAIGHEEPHVLTVEAVKEVVDIEALRT